MTDRTLTDRNGVSWVRVSKRRARSAYNEGHTITVAPANMDPFNPWYTCLKISNKRQWGCDVTFDSIINEYEYYNCNSAELGRYPAYYVRTEVLA